jgi:thiol-disulfide isomerase/thioredoxin
MNPSNILSYLGIWTCLLLWSSCFEIPHEFTQLPPGQWRGVLKLDPANWDRAKVAGRDVNPIVTYEEATMGELPFNFEIAYVSADSFTFAIRNSDEIVYADRIHFGLDRSTAKDTLIVFFDTYDSYIKAIFEEKVIQGEFRFNTRDDYRIPFVAHYGKNHRFSELKKTPVMDVSGRWNVVLDQDGEKPRPAIGEFQQEGNRLKGTFLTQSGDYRYLEGNILANKLYLSAFDGGHVLLFEGKILEDSTLVGTFWSGLTYKVAWSGKREGAPALASPLSITKTLTPELPFAFRFTNTQGSMVSLEDPEFKNKAKVIQITGTWCPNCKDESRFLMEYLEEYKPDDIAFIGISFEKYKDTLLAYQRMEIFADKLKITYPILYGGLNNAEAVKQALPMLNGIFAYPTTIYLDKKNRVRKIYTGFNGPATSEYEHFTRDFHQTMLEITQE